MLLEPEWIGEGRSIERGLLLTVLVAGVRCEWAHFGVGTGLASNGGCGVSVHAGIEVPPGSRTAADGDDIHFHDELSLPTQPAVVPLFPFYIFFFIIHCRFLRSTRVILFRSVVEFEVIILSSLLVYANRFSYLQISNVFIALINVPSELDEDRTFAAISNRGNIDIQNWHLTIIHWLVNFYYIHSSIGPVLIMISIEVYSFQVWPGVNLVKVTGKGIDYYIVKNIG